MVPSRLPRRWPVEKIINMFIESKGKDFDPDVIDVFLKVKDEMIDVSILMAADNR